MRHYKILTSNFVFNYWFITITTTTHSLNFTDQDYVQFNPITFHYSSFHRSIHGITFGYRTCHSKGGHHKE